MPMTASTTDPTRWRLIVDEGVHQWRYVSEADSARRVQSTAEKYFLGLPTVSELSSAAKLELCWLTCAGIAVTRNPTQLSAICSQWFPFLSKTPAG